MPGNHDNGNVNIGLFCSLQELDAIDLGHLDIAKDDIVFFFFHLFEPFLAITRLINLIPLIGKDLTECLTDRFFVINNQNVRHRFQIYGNK